MNKLLLTLLIAVAVVTACQITTHQPESIDENPTACAVYIATKTLDADIFELVDEMPSSQSAYARELIDFNYSKFDDSDSSYEKGHFLARVAGAYGRIGEKDKANGIISQAIGHLNSCPDGEKRGILLSTIAWACVETGELDKAMEFVRRIKRSYIFSNVTPRVILQYEEAGKREKAIELLSQFTDRARSIKRKHMKAIALSLIVYGYLQCDEIENAEKVGAKCQHHNNDA